MTRHSDRDPLVGSDAPSEAQQERRWYYHNFRQAFGKMGATYALGRGPDTRWFVECILPTGDKRRLGSWPDFEQGLRVQDYCVGRDTAVKMALIQLYEHANYDPMEKLLEDALTFGELPRRRIRVTVEIDVDMRGTDEEIKYYIEASCRTMTCAKAARVTEMDGPRITEPRPEPET